jgi:uncharacterized protein (TIGR03382 family)
MTFDSSRRASPGTGALVYALPRLAFCLALLAVGPSAFAADLYVAPTGRSGNPGTASAPLDTPQSALQRARPGDRILVRAGTYAGGGWIDARGTAQAPITVLSVDGPRRAVLQGGGESLRLGEGASYLVFDGLEIRNATNNVIHIDGNSHHITLRNVFAHDAGRDGDVVKVNQAAHIYIEGGEYARPGPRPGSSENPYQECIDFLAVDTLVVRDAWIHDGGSSLIYAKGGSRNVVFERNLINEQRAGASDPMVGLGGVTGVDFLGDGSFEAYDIVFRNNIVQGGASGGIAIYDARGAYIANNLFLDVNTVLVQFRPGAGTARRTENVRVIDNLFVDTRGRMPSPIGRTGGNAVTQLVWQHNLFWNNGGGVPSGTLLNVTTQPGHLLANPGIRAATGSRDTLARTLRPADGSPATNSGVDTTAAPFGVTVDINGLARAGRTDRGPWNLGLPLPPVGTTPDAGVPATDAGTPPPRDSGVVPPRDSGVVPPRDAGVVPTLDSGTAPPDEDAGIAPSEDASAPSDDTGDEVTEGSSSNGCSAAPGGHRGPATALSLGLAAGLVGLVRRRRRAA